MKTIAAKVLQRLAETDSASNTQSASMNRAIELSDRFEKVTPQEYILPLNLFCHVPSRVSNPIGNKEEGVARIRRLF
jgi:hypothetical protein